jgi:phosphatidate phosphatase APP1
MKIKFILSILSILLFSSACTQGDELLISNELDNQELSVSTLSTKAINSIEPENQEILIDEEYYKSFPDPELGNQIYQSLITGNFNNEFKVKESDAIKTQSFFSIFNKKAYINIYDSFGNEKNFYVTGRVFKKKSIKPVNVNDSLLTNIIRNIKYFTPDPIENTDVTVSLGGLSQTAKTDNRGYFKAYFTGVSLPLGIHNVTAKLNSNKYKFDIPKGELIFDKTSSNEIGIVSDIDDTIKVTGVDSKLKMIKHVFTGNFKTDKPIPGMATLYRGILNDNKADGADAVHYVTGSPSHLYDRIQDFMNLNGFPQGSIELRKFGSRVDPSPSTTLEYKLSKIRPILNSFPNKKFIMFGDTTQQDTEVYSQLKREFPNNVIAIYINNVTKQDPSNPRFKDVILTNSTKDAAKDLFDKGLISQDTLNKVISEVRN